MDEFRHGPIALKARFRHAGVDDFYNTPFSHPYPVFNQFIDVFISEIIPDDNQPLCRKEPIPEFHKHRQERPIRPELGRCHSV